MSEPTMEDIKAHMPNKTLPTTGSATKDPTCKEVGALYDMIFAAKMTRYTANDRKRILEKIKT